MCFKDKYENSVSEYIKNWMNTVQFESKRFGCVCVFFSSFAMQHKNQQKNIEKDLYNEWDKMQCGKRLNFGPVGNMRAKFTHW